MVKKVYSYPSRGTADVHHFTKEQRFTFVLKWSRGSQSDCKADSRKVGTGKRGKIKGHVGQCETIAIADYWLWSLRSFKDQLVQSLLHDETKVWEDRFLGQSSLAAEPIQELQDRSHYCTPNFPGSHHFHFTSNTPIFTFLIVKIKVSQRAGISSR